MTTYDDFDFAHEEGADAILKRCTVDSWTPRDVEVNPEDVTVCRICGQEHLRYLYGITDPESGLRIDPVGSTCIEQYTTAAKPPHAQFQQGQKHDVIIAMWRDYLSRTDDPAKDMEYHVAFREIKGKTHVSWSYVNARYFEALTGLSADERSALDARISERVTRDRLEAERMEAERRAAHLAQMAEIEASVAAERERKRILAEEKRLAGLVAAQARARIAVEDIFVNLKKFNQMYPAMAKSMGDKATALSTYMPISYDEIYAIGVKVFEE